MVSDKKDLLIALLEDILNSDSLETRAMAIERAIKILKSISDEKSEEIVQKFVELKEKILPYVVPTSDLLKWVEKEFPDVYPELLKNPSLAYLVLIANTSVKVYKSGKIIISISLDKGERKFEFKLRHIDVYKFKKSLEGGGEPKWLINPLIIITILGIHSDLKADIYRIALRYHLDLLDMITRALMNPLPFDDKDEEAEFEQTITMLANYNYIYRWEDRLEVVKKAPVDPRFIIFVDDKYVYIPSPWFTYYAKHVKRPAVIFKKLLDADVRTFYTSYSEGGVRTNVYYLIIPKDVLKSKLGIQIVPKSLEEFIEEDVSKVEEAVKKLFELDKEDDSKV